MLPQLQYLLMAQINHLSEQIPSPTAQIGAAAFCIIFPYFKLHHVSRLYDELTGGESIVGLVLLFIWPVEVEGWVATESCCPYCVRVKTPVFFMGRSFC